LSRAAQWFVRSGIQQAEGGVARYYRPDLECNQPVSTEITGYAVSTLLLLDEPDAARAAARYLVRAWSRDAMPFELVPEPRFTYFFDCGIVVRGLLAAWRATGEPQFLDLAVEIGKAMRTDFAAQDGTYHPVLELPGKRPASWDASRWSQSPGCYQLKSALAWWDLFEATGETQFRRAYEDFLQTALRCYPTFLPGHSNPLKVVDRLHAFLYFLEGTSACLSHDACVAAVCDGIQQVACHLTRLAPQFERSDVYAQLLRMRVYADWAGVLPLDRAAAQHESQTLAEFQASSTDPRIDGGFYFGRQGSTWLPYVNPVSTAFATQALALWDQHCRGSAPGDCRLLI
jgi:hypothetical protein